MSMWRRVFTTKTKLKKCDFKIVEFSFCSCNYCANEIKVIRSIERKQHKFSDGIDSIFNVTSCMYIITYCT